MPQEAMDTPVVSIIVPTYNTADYLPELIDSVLAQQLTSWQLVIIDDGSTDDTAEVVQPYLDAYANIEYHVVENGGPGRARNIGTQYARGAWLMFADADDIIVETALAHLVDLGEREGCDIVTGDIKRLVGDKLQNSGLHRLAFDGVREGRTTIYESPSLLYNTTACNTIYRRCFYERAGITWAEGHFYEDVATTMPCLFEAKSIGVLKEVVYLWRIRDNESQSTTQKYATIRNFTDRMWAIRHVDAYFDAHVADDELRVAKDFKWLSHDMRIYLNRFAETEDAEYRKAVMDEVAAYLDHIEPRAFAKLRAIDKIKYELVRRHDANGIARAAAYDFDHFPDLQIEQREGRIIGRFPFEDISDDIADMTDELREHGIQTRTRRVELAGNTLKVEALMQLGYLEQSQAQVTARLVAEDGSVVATTKGSCTPLDRSSEDAQDFNRFGSPFKVSFGFTKLFKLVRSMSDGIYRIELEAAFEDIACAPVALANPAQGLDPRPFPLIVDGRMVVVGYDVAWRLTLTIKQPELPVVACRLERNERFVFELANGEGREYAIPDYDEGERQDFVLEGAEYVGPRSTFFVRRAPVDDAALQQGLMLADTDGNHGFELWRLSPTTQGLASLQQMRPGGIIDDFVHRAAWASISFVFPIPLEVNAAHMLLYKDGEERFRFALEDRGYAQGGRAFRIQLDCGSEELACVPAGVYRIKLELELQDGTLVVPALSSEPRSTAVNYVKANGRYHRFDRRSGSLKLNIWKTS